jgi:hypothetical protein
LTLDEQEAEVCFEKTSQSVHDIFNKGGAQIADENILSFGF